jgi:hypothetical protein
MREGYVIADGESVGLVCLSVHYKNSGVFVAYDVEAHAALPSIKTHTGKRASRSLMMSY